METMHEYSGIGLAGPQVHESLRMFVAGLETEGGKLRVVPFINPEITPVGDRIEEDWEGCLSIPDIRGRVPRHHEVVVKVARPARQATGDGADRVLRRGSCSTRPTTSTASSSSTACDPSNR